jgi:hypothetical protein
LGIPKRQGEEKKKKEHLPKRKSKDKLYSPKECKERKKPPSKASTNPG